MEWIEQIEQEIHESRAVKAALAEQSALLIAEIAQLLVTCIQGGRKILLFGNGGSAADAQHIAAEFVGRYRIERRGLPAIALSDNPAITTAVANDYGFDQVFSRQIEALGKVGDVAIAISTSGNSPSVLHGITAARSQGLTTIGLTGKTGGKMRDMLDFCVCVPSKLTPRIQEAHMLIGHILSGIVENSVCGHDHAAMKNPPAEKALK